MEMGAAAKAAAGLFLAAGGGAGAYYGYKHLTRDTSSSATPAETQDNTVGKTQFDTALINFLDAAKNQDIIFEVKKGEAFADDLQATDLDSPTLPLKVRVQVKVTEAMKANEANGTFKFTPATGTDAHPLKEIKELNKGKAWTWSCDFEFKKLSTATKTALADDPKKQIMTADNKGLFGILKKDVKSYANTDDNNHWTKAKLMEAKKEFIKACSSKRADANAKVAAGSDLTKGELNVKVQAFEFKDGANGNAEKLVANDEAEFKKFFKEEYRTKNYKTN